MHKKEPETTTEDRILDAAFDVLEQHTLSGVRMALVAERAGLFQSNIHYYYKSKHELLLAVQKKVFDHCLELRRSLGGDETSLEDQLESFWGQKKDFILREPKYDYAEIDFWSQSRVDQQMRAEVVASFSHWRREIAEMLSHFCPQPDKCRMLAAVMVSMMEGATIQYLVDPGVFDLDDYFTYCSEIVLKEMRS